MYLSFIKNKVSYKFSKKKKKNLHLAEKRAGAERVKKDTTFRKMKDLVVYDKMIIIIWCFILCERQFFYKNSLALRTDQSKSHNITIYILH